MAQKKEMRAVVLAAGKSTRMKSDKSKVVHQILGKEIINILLDNLIQSGFEEENIIVVAGENLEELKKVIKKKVKYVIQDKPLGTAHALLSASEYMKDFSGSLLVTVGDNPFISPDEFKPLIEYHHKHKSVCSFITTVFPHIPPPYGRVLRDAQGEVTGVVEELDATPEQLDIREVNSSIYMFDCKTVFPLLLKIGNDNVKGEYYLTDIIEILKSAKHRLHGVKVENHMITMGINNRWELAQAHQWLNQRNQRTLALEEGVTILQPETVTVEFDVEVGKDTVIYPSTYIAAGTRIGHNCQIGPFAYLATVHIPSGEQVVMEKRTWR